MLEWSPKTKRLGKSWPSTRPLCRRRSWPHGRHLRWSTEATSV